MFKKLSLLTIFLTGAALHCQSQKTFSTAGNFILASNCTGGLPIAGDNLIISAACTVDNASTVDYGGTAQAVRGSVLTALRVWLWI